MQGASRESLATLRESLAGRTGSAGANDLQQVSDALFSVVTLFANQGALRRTLSDPALEAQRKERFVDALFAERLDETSLSVVRETARLRWSAPGDVVDAIEALAVETALQRAEVDGVLDEVEDELFRFGRIVSSNTELRAALTNRSATTAAKSELLRGLLGGRAERTTERLVTRLVTAPRGRSLESGLESLSKLAADRRDRMVAVVTSAVPLSDTQKQRLGAALAKVYGRPMHLNLDVDPEVLGGIRVQVGDEVINGSIADRLEDAGRRLAS